MPYGRTDGIRTASAESKRAAAYGTTPGVAPGFLTPPLFALHAMMPGEYAPSRLEQAALTAPGAALRRGEAQMLPGRGGPDAAPGRAGQQALAHQKRLGDLFHPLTLLPPPDRQGRQAPPAAPPQPEQGAEHRRAQPVQPPAVHVVDRQGARGDLPGDDAVRLDLGVVAHPAQQPVRDTGRAAGAPGDLGRALGLYGHLQQPGGAVDHALQHAG